MTTKDQFAISNLITEMYSEQSGIVKLEQDEFGNLSTRTPDGELEMLMGYSSGGEPVTFKFPMSEYQQQYFSNALYDAIETGMLPSSTTAVQLPDGSTFEIPK
jgi:hypothetical protein